MVEVLLHWLASLAFADRVPVCQLLQRGSHAVASQGAAISRQIERLGRVIANPWSATWIIAGLDLVFSGEAGALCFLCNKRPAWTADEGGVGTSRRHEYRTRIGRNTMARSPKDVPTSIASGPTSTESSQRRTSDPQRDRTDALSSRETGEAVHAGDQTSEDIQPDDEAVRRLAYEIWEREGKQPGRDQEYWHRAKELLRARSR